MRRMEWRFRLMEKFLLSPQVWITMVIWICTSVENWITTIGLILNNWLSVQKKEERSIFIAADGKTVYFGSSGYGGFGGLDIFKTTLYDDDSFGEITNIGAPFNTKEHDFGFIIGALGNEVFFCAQ